MLKLILLISFIAFTSAQVCNIKTCWTVFCAPVTKDNCAGVIKTRGGYCGCCDACVTELAEGDPCVPDLLLTQSKSPCGDHMYCDSHSNTCKPIITRQVRSSADGPCTIKLAAVIAEQSQHVVYGLERPHCDNATGDYLGMQFSGSQAVCFTKNGTFIPGYMVYRWLGDDMNCQCARDEFHYKDSGLVGKTFNCAQNGNYARVGCTGSVCYCQDQYGKQIGTSTVDIGNRDSLNC